MEFYFIERVFLKWILFGFLFDEKKEFDEGGFLLIMRKYICII